MDYRLVILLYFCFALYVSALSIESDTRSKRDVMESMKNAWNEVVKTLSDAGDAVVHVFKPTEKSIVNKVAEVFQPTEKSLVDKMADGVKSLTQ